MTYVCETVEEYVNQALLAKKEMQECRHLMEETAIKFADSKASYDKSLTDEVLNSLLLKVVMDEPSLINSLSEEDQVLYLGKMKQYAHTRILHGREYGDDEDDY